MTIQTDIDARLMQGKTDGKVPALLHLGHGSYSALAAHAPELIEAQRYKSIPIRVNPLLDGWDVDFAWPPL